MKMINIIYDFQFQIKPTMRRRCVQGVIELNRTFPKTAIHVAFGCPWKHDSVVNTHLSDMSVPSHTWLSSRCRVTCHGQSPGAAIFDKLIAVFADSMDWTPHSVKNNIDKFSKKELLFISQ